MPLVSDQLPNLMNGVSQQSVTMRMSSQCEEQVNGFSSIVEGVNKRPPLQHKSKIIDGQIGSAFVHTVIRDSGEQYSVVIADGDIRVFDLDGQELSVSKPNGTEYLSSPDSQSSFRALTINDATIIVNTGETVAKSNARTAARQGKTVLFVKGVNYGVDYTINLGGEEVATYSTPSSDGAPKIATDLVAKGLVTQLNSAGLDGYTFKRHHNIIVATPDDGVAGEWEFLDSFSGTYTGTIDDEVERFSDLPTVAPDKFRVRVTGDGSTAADKYYLAFESKVPGQISSGVWVETLNNDIQYRLSPSTMPHRLQLNPDGTFSFETIDWGERTVGDEDTAPWPSFVGEKIRDLYYDRNRLCFLSQENVSMSRSRYIFEFFPTTVTTLLDDGPIDIAAPATNSATLRSAVPFNKQIILFGDRSQFALDVDTLIASEPPAIRVLTDFETDKATVPVSVGRTMYFTVTRGRYTAVMEYYVIADSDVTDAADVTKHVPTYIPSGAFKLAASPTTDVVFALVSDAPNQVYVYKYYWRGNEKVQSSWSRWEFTEGCKVLNVDFVKDTAVFIIQRSDGVYIDTMNVAEGQTDADTDYVCRLDRRVSEEQVAAVYDPDTVTTAITLPYETDPTAGYRVATRRGSSDGRPEATTLNVVSAEGNVVTVRGDARAMRYYVGEAYSFIYRFSEAILKKSAPGGGLAPITAGRLQINKWHVTYARTGYFRAEVEVQGRPSYRYPFTGKVLGTSSATVGKPSIADGTLGFRVNAKANRTRVTLVNDSFLPCYFTAAEWEGRFERKTSRA